MIDQSKSMVRNTSQTATPRRTRVKAEAIPEEHVKSTYKESSVQSKSLTLVERQLSRAHPVLRHCSGLGILTPVRDDDEAEAEAEEGVVGRVFRLKNGRYFSFSVFMVRADALPTPSSTGHVGKVQRGPGEKLREFETDSRA
jgi:hypothetical protein